MLAPNLIAPRITLEDFLKLPETKPASEYLEGEVYQKPMPQGEHSTLQGELVTGINQVAKPNKIAYAFPELRCTFGGRSIVPDIVVFTWDRIPRTESGRIANQFEIYPDWMIEILSPRQSANKIIKKIFFCLQQETKLVWLIDPEDESVLTFRPDVQPEIKEGDDIIPALPALTEWRLTVREMFAWLTP
jgi:Uma2 family endonuclease